MKNKFSMFLALVMAFSLVNFSVFTYAATPGDAAVIIDKPAEGANLSEVVVSGWAFSADNDLVENSDKIKVEVNGTEVTGVNKVVRNDVKKALEADGYIVDSNLLGFEGTIAGSAFKNGEQNTIKVSVYDTKGEVRSSNQRTITYSSDAPKTVPLILVDSPAEGSTVSSLNVNGWALFSHDASTDGIDKINVTVNGETVPATRVARADITKTNVPGYPDASYAKAGFSATVDISTVEDDKALTVKIELVNKDGKVIDGGTVVRNITKKAGYHPLAARLDTPEHLATVSTTVPLDIAGWVLFANSESEGSGITEITASISGVEGETTLEKDKFIARPDLRVNVPGYPDFVYDQAGYVFSIPSEKLTGLDGDKVLNVTYYAGDKVAGRFYQRIEFSPAPVPKAPIMDIELPVDDIVINNDQLTVAGWALATEDGTNSDIKDVVIKVEEVTTDVAKSLTAKAEHFDRADLKDIYVGYGDYSNAGFKKEKIDISSLKDGELTVTVTANLVANPLRSIETSVTITKESIGKGTDLANIILTGSPIGFTFKPATYDYTGITVETPVDKITVTPTGSATQTITVNGTEVGSGKPASVELAEGANTIVVVAKEAKKNDVTYTIEVTRLAATALASVKGINATSFDITLEDSRSITVSDLKIEKKASSSTTWTVIPGTSGFTIKAKADSDSKVYTVTLITSLSNNTEVKVTGQGNTIGELAFPYMSPIEISKTTNPVVSSDNKVAVTLATDHTTKLTDNDTQRFQVFFKETAPTASTAFVPVEVSALTHEPDLAPAKVALTIASLKGFEGVLKVNTSNEVAVDFLAPIVTSSEVIRKTDTTASLTLKYSSATKAGTYKYLIDPSGTATAPTKESELITGNGTFVAASKEFTISLTGLIANRDAKVYVMLADNATTPNKTEILAYSIMSVVQPPASGHVITKDTVGKYKSTVNTSSGKAYVIVSTEEPTTPNIGEAMPTTGGKEIAANTAIGATSGVVGQWVAVYEEGTTTGKVAKFSKTKLASDLTLGAPKVPGVEYATSTILQQVKASKTIAIEDGTIQSNVTDASAYTFFFADKNDLAAPNSYTLSWDSATALKLPSTCPEDGDYYVYAYHNASKTISPSTVKFTVDNTAPVVEVVKIERTGIGALAADAVLTVKVDETIRTATGKGLYANANATEYKVPTYSSKDGGAVTDTKLPISTNLGVNGAGYVINKLTASAAAKYYVTVWAVDNAGNVSTTVNVLLPEYIAEVPAGEYEVVTNAANLDSVSGTTGKIFYDESNDKFIITSAGFDASTKPFPVSTATHGAQIKKGIVALRGYVVGQSEDNVIVVDANKNLQTMKVLADTTILESFAIEKGQAFESTVAKLSIAPGVEVTLEDGGTATVAFDKDTSHIPSTYVGDGAKYIIKGTESALKVYASAQTKTWIGSAGEQFEIMTPDGVIEMAKNINGGISYKIVSGTVKIHDEKNVQIAQHDSLIVNDGAKLVLGNVPRTFSNIDSANIAVTGGGTLTINGELQTIGGAISIFVKKDGSTFNFKGNQIVGSDGIYKLDGEAYMAMSQIDSGWVSIDTTNETNFSLFGNVILGSIRNNKTLDWVTLKQNLSIPAGGTLNLADNTKLIVNSDVTLTIGTAAKIYGTANPVTNTEIEFKAGSRSVTERTQDYAFAPTGGNASNAGDAKSDTTYNPSINSKTSLWIAKAAVSAPEFE